jgi:hypothetical protein
VAARNNFFSNRDEQLAEQNWSATFSHLQAILDLALNPVERQ